MAEIIELSKYRKMSEKKEENSSKKCTILSFDKHYALKLIENSAIKLNKKNDFGALLDMNKALEILFTNSKSNVETSLIGIVHLNAKNYDLARLHFYKTIAQSRRLPTPLVLFLSCILDLDNKQNASLFFKNLIFQNAELPLVQYAELANGIKKEMSNFELDRYNIKFSKKIFCELALANNFKEARTTLDNLWQLDNTDPYISYWYFNYKENCDVSEIDKIPVEAIKTRINSLFYTCFVKNDLKEIIKREDNDSLINFILNYCEIDLCLAIFKCLIELKNSRINYHINNALFSVGHEDKKLQLFLESIRQGMCYGEDYAFTYNDVIVKVAHFSYKDLKRVKLVLSDSVLNVVEYLIKNGFKTINLNDVFIKFVDSVYASNREDLLEDEHYCTNMLLIMYYEHNGLTLTDEMNEFKNYIIHNM